MWWRLYICSCCHIINNDYCAVAAWGKTLSISGLRVPGNPTWRKLHALILMIIWLYHYVSGTDVWWNWHSSVCVFEMASFHTDACILSEMDLSGSLSRTKHQWTHYPWATDDSTAICATNLFSSERSILLKMTMLPYLVFVALRSCLD